MIQVNMIPKLWFGLTVVFSSSFSYKIEWQCAWDLYDCVYPYNLEQTLHFRCRNFDDCPTNFMCCHHRCFRHKICQPFPNRPHIPVPNDNFEERPEECDVIVTCDTPLPEAFTKSFQCLQDNDCPDFYKCCFVSCYNHKVCQPAKHVFSTPSTAALTNKPTFKSTSPLPKSTLLETSTNSSPDEKTIATTIQKTSLEEAFTTISDTTTNKLLTAQPETTTRTTTSKILPKTSILSTSEITSPTPPSEILSKTTVLTTNQETTGDTTTTEDPTTAKTTDNTTADITITKSPTLPTPRTTQLATINKTAPEVSTLLITPNTTTHTITSESSSEVSTLLTTPKTTTHTSSESLTEFLTLPISKSTEYTTTSKTFPEVSTLPTTPKTTIHTITTSTLSLLSTTEHTIASKTLAEVSTISISDTTTHTSANKTLKEALTLPSIPYTTAHTITSEVLSEAATLTTTQKPIANTTTNKTLTEIPILTISETITHTTANTQTTGTNVVESSILTTTHTIPVFYEPTTLAVEVNTTLKNVTEVTINQNYSSSSKSSKGFSSSDEFEASGDVIIDDDDEDERKEDEDGIANTTTTKISTETDDFEASGDFSIIGDDEDEDDDDTSSTLKSIRNITSINSTIKTTKPLPIEGSTTFITEASSDFEIIEDDHDEMKQEKTDTKTTVKNLLDNITTAITTQQWEGGKDSNIKTTQAQPLENSTYYFTRNYKDMANTSTETGNSETSRDLQITNDNKDERIDDTYRVNNTIFTTAISQQMNSSHNSREITLAIDSNKDNTTTTTTTEIIRNTETTLNVIYQTTSRDGLSETPTKANYSRPLESIRPSTESNDCEASGDLEIIGDDEDDRKVESYGGEDGASGDLEINEDDDEDMASTIYVQVED